MVKTFWMIAVGLALAAPCAAQATPQPPTEPAQVVVTTGEGVVRRAPDRAWVTIASENRARTAQEAQRANADAMSAVNAQLKAAGITGDAIQTLGFSLQPEFDYVNGRQTLRDYVARNAVQARVDALPKLGDIIAVAVANGATNVSGIRFDVQDREGAERDALRRAVADARARAEAAAAGAGLKVDRIVRIEEQREVAIPMPVRALGGPMARGADAAVPVPIESGEIEIHAKVTLTAAVR